MNRFCTFIQSSRGEELVAFCVRVSRLLAMNAEDPRYHSLLTVIKVVHLREGSSVPTACRISTDAFVDIMSGDHPDGDRKQVLAQMYTKTLQRLQVYWLPQFLQCCKTSIQRVSECSSVAQQYSSIASLEAAAVDLRPFPQDAGLGLGLEEKEGLPPGSSTVTYCSKHTKRLLWTEPLEPATTTLEAEGLRPSFCQWLPFGGATDQEGCTNVVHNQMDFQAVATDGEPKKTPLTSKEGSGRAREADPCLASTAPSRQEESQVKEVVVPHVCLETPALYLPVNLPVPASPPELRGLRYLTLALSADGIAGGPFHAFLREKSLRAQLCHLALWQELELFLRISLRAQGDDSFDGHKQAVARRIILIYLSEAAETEVQLEAETSSHLSRLLPSGTVIPWIYKARHEICQVLWVSYDAFLDEEDNCFSSYVFDNDKSEDENCGWILTSSGHHTAEQQRSRMREALALSQACCSHGDDASRVSEESWAQIALEDVARGGSVHMQYIKCDPFDLPFELLALRYPNKAAEQLSLNYQLYYKKMPSFGESTKTVPSSTVIKRIPIMLKKNSSFMRRPSMRPRSFADVFRSSVSLDFFKRFLRVNNAYGPLQYIQEVEKLKALDHTKAQRTKVHAIVDRFFLRSDSMKYLQCKADIIFQVSQMQHVTCATLYNVQEMVSKSLESTWFKVYQDTFPPCPTVVTDTTQRATLLSNKLRNVWRVLTRFIKSVCKFRNAMKDPSTRSTFEQYLRHSYASFSEACSDIVLNQTHSDAPLPPKEEGDAPMKVRVINRKVIVVDFLVNDLSFYLECERFRSLADACTVMESAGMNGENDHDMLHKKADMIVMLFLKSEISPKLRINIAENQRDFILQHFWEGEVDRGLFHPAILSVFPNLIFCWRKFCCQKVTNNLTVVKGTKKPLLTSPDYLNPLKDQYRKIKTITSAAEEQTTLRFTIHHGLRLILPLFRSEVKEDLPTKVPSHHRSISSVHLKSISEHHPHLSTQLPHPDGGITPEGAVILEEGQHK
ncbi:regulator of G-protein signaling protein-like isoform X1 [Osmerus eperlanus]|uniref:regulator of G-protein signaling protein-like isoform X1 n=2 Tax=Osmerus eperlanus TaxID=29151 RepID=UPI002E136811